MAFVDSYLWRLRQKVGSDLLLMPGAMIALQRPDGHVLLTKRGDTGSWCLPGGAAEVGGSFAKTAIEELAEEVGVEAAAEDLIPFGCLSAAETHTIDYPNGDVTHCFALCFLLRRWRGEPTPDTEEATAVLFTAPDELPEPMHDPSVHAMAQLRRFLGDGGFQVG
ncbi:MAG TPA: NUDIX domain-containing protein [Solirubrobacterales bacterium]|nr:NUDIX domain-containing protein [Solirubrobacterales bacterium]